MKSYRDNNDLCVVLRRSGERTQDLSLQQLSTIFGHDAVESVDEIPFEKALNKGFEISIENSCKWTLHVDADVIPNKKFLLQFISQSKTLSDEYFVSQPVVFDKLLNQYRPAGVKLYRTGLLELAKTLIPPAAESLRPESYVLKKMAGLGYPGKSTRYPVGTHDFGQYYADIYRKSFVHGQKHGSAIANCRFLIENMRDDLDYFVSVVGTIAGYRSDSIAPIDKEYYEKDTRTMLSHYGLSEKAPMEQDEADRLLNSAQNIVEIYGKYFGKGDYNLAKSKISRYGMRKGIQLALRDIIG